MASRTVRTVARRRGKRAPKRADHSVAAEELIHDMSMPDPEAGNWLVGMPAYRGLFTYEVGGPDFPQLGNGVFLWQLEILANTMKITEMCVS